MRWIVEAFWTDASCIHVETDTVTCREFADFIMGYLAAELPADTQASFQRHLSLCDNCQAYLKSYEDTVKLGKRAFDDANAAIPADIPEDLIKAIVSARRSL